MKPPDTRQVAVVRDCELPRPAYIRAWIWTASDCYRNCLSEPAVHVVLTAPRSLAELEQNLDVLELPPMSKQERDQWERFGNLVYGAGKGAFETSWP